MTYNVFGGTLSLTLSIYLSIYLVNNSYHSCSHLYSIKDTQSTSVYTQFLRVSGGIMSEGHYCRFPVLMPPKTSERFLWGY